MEINPAILTADPHLATQQINLVKTESDFEVLQIDVIDGFFADYLTIRPADLLGLDLTGLELDIQLMTEEPMDYVWEMIEQAKELPIRAVYGQIERMSDQFQFLEEVKKQNWQAGLALDLFTPVESLDDDAWQWLDTVLLMSVEAGAQGQRFNHLVIKKIKALQTLAQHNNCPIKIALDGGIKAKHLSTLAELGVDRVAIGSALFAAADFTRAATTLKEACHG